MAWREKNRPGFSHVRVRIRSNEFSPSNICLYTIAAGVARLRTGVAARIDSGHILSRVDVNSAHIGTSWRDMAMMQSVFITCLPYII